MGENNSIKKTIKNILKYNNTVFSYDEELIACELFKYYNYKSIIKYLLKKATYYNILSLVIKYFINTLKISPKECERLILNYELLILYMFNIDEKINEKYIYKYRICKIIKSEFNLDILRNINKICSDDLLQNNDSINLQEEDIYNYIKLISSVDDYEVYNEYKTKIKIRIKSKYKNLNNYLNLGINYFIPSNDPTKYYDKMKKNDTLIASVLADSDYVKYTIKFMEVDTLNKYIEGKEAPFFLLTYLLNDFIKNNVNDMRMYTSYISTNFLKIVLKDTHIEKMPEEIIVDKKINENIYNMSLNFILNGRTYALQDGKINKLN